MREKLRTVELRYRRAATTLFIAGLALLACEGAKEPRRDGFHELPSRLEAGEQTGAADAARLVAAAERSNAASFTLWRAFAERTNFVVSPYSIRSALALVYLAALPGPGRSSLQSGLLYPERNEDLDIRLLDGALRATGEARFESANAVWVARQHAVRPAYLDAVSRTLPAEVHAVDFETSPERAQRMINAWVSDRTRGKIPEILKESAVSERTLTVLVNAVYFFGKWNSPFDPSLTAPKPFFTSRGTIVQAPTMMGATCSAVFGSDYQAAYADYGGSTSMVFVVVVPKLWHEFQWDAAALRRVWGARRGLVEVPLELPKFSLRSRRMLGDVFRELALDVRDPRLLQGLLESNEETQIDVAVHEAFIQVDETSTEAAAATGITQTPDALFEKPRRVFRVDRPFYFMLVERRTGLVVFMGQVTDPTTSGT